jgi:hypothetical protein
MKKLRREVDFMYPSEETILKKYERHHSRNQGERALTRAIHHAERQRAKSSEEDI